MLAVVVSFDRWPVGALGCYGGADGLTPQIDRLAAESVIFDRHFAADLSESPSGHAWWSGRAESIDFSAPSQDVSLHDGSDLFEACRQAGVMVELIADRAALAVVPPPNGAGVSIIDGPDATAQVLETARRRIAAIDPQERRLLWLLGSTAALAPATDAASESADTAGEDDELAELWSAIDEAVGSIWTDLRNRCAGERCLFVLTAARGWLPSVVASLPVPWTSLAEGQAHVPLIVNDFGRCEPGRCPVLSSAAELAPTLLDWSAIPGATLPSGEPSLLPWIDENQPASRPTARPAAREAVGWVRKDRNNHGWAIRTDEFLLITRTRPASPFPSDTPAAEGQQEDQHTSDTETGPMDIGHAESHLFVKPDDRWDLHDVAPQEPETVAALRESALR